MKLQMKLKKCIQLAKQWTILYTDTTWCRSDLFVECADLQNRPCHSAMKERRLWPWQCAFSLSQGSTSLHICVYIYISLYIHTHITILQWCVRMCVYIYIYHYIYISQFSWGLFQFRVEKHPQAESPVKISADAVSFGPVWPMSKIGSQY